MFRRWLANILIGMLSLWAIYAVLASAMGGAVVFPMSSTDDNSVPMWRLLTIRHAVFCTFAFYGAMHLLQGSKEVFPVHFLKTFLFFLGFVGLISTVARFAEGAIIPWTSWAIILFFIVAWAILHSASAPKYRRYFGSK